MRQPKYPSTHDFNLFWAKIEKSKERQRNKLARLSFSEKIEILERMQRDNWPTNQGVPHE